MTCFKEVPYSFLEALLVQLAQQVEVALLAVLGTRSITKKRNNSYRELYRVMGFTWSRTGDRCVHIAGGPFSFDAEMDVKHTCLSTSPT